MPFRIALKYVGDMGAQPAIITPKYIVEGISATPLLSLRDWINNSVTDCNLDTVIYTRTWEYNGGPPEAGANIKKRAVFQLRNATKSTNMSFSIPAPKESIYEQTTQGQRIKQNIQDELASRLTSAIFYDLAPIDGYIIEKK